MEQTNKTRSWNGEGKHKSQVMKRFRKNPNPAKRALARLLFFGGRVHESRLQFEREAIKLQTFIKIVQILISRTRRNISYLFLLFFFSGSLFARRNFCCLFGVVWYSPGPGVECCRSPTLGANDNTSEAYEREKSFNYSTMKRQRKKSQRMFASLHCGAF